MRCGSLVLVLPIAALGFRLLAQEPAGNRAYRGGDYPTAVERYREALARRSLPRIEYNLGTALLRLGEWESAGRRLSAALQAQSPELRARAFYNLGNAEARAGQEEGVGREALRAAIDAYRRALLLDPGGEDARWNLELAQRRLAELERSGPSSPEADDLGAGAEGSEDRDAGGRPLDAGSAPDRERPVERESRDAGAAAAPDAPLPLELAEQILRAVEERERGLQRDKLRRQRGRARGPDW